MTLKIKNKQILYPLSGSFSGSFDGNISNAISASYALTASYALNGGVGGNTFPFTGSAIITGSLTITGSLNATQGITGSLLGTASFANNSLSSSFAISSSKAISSSYADTSISSSFAISSSRTVSASFATTASFAISSSYANNSLSSSFSSTASYANNSLTASYALNGGVTQLLAGPNITLSPISGLGQVTISSTGTVGPFFNTATGSYGSFYDTTTQTNPVANIPRSMSFNNTDITNGVSVSGSTNPFNTYIKTENHGVYNIQFSAQVEKTDSGTDVIVIWLRKNGIDLIDSATKLTLTGNGTKVVAAWNWFASSAANDYYQIIWSSADTGMRLYAEPAGGTPGIPSVILTVNRVDQFLSNTGSFNGSFTGQFTGSLFGTSSYANNSLSASFATSASFIGFTPENIINKSINLTSPDNIKYPTTQAVVNEFNRATITVELISSSSVNFYAPYSLTVNSFTTISMLSVPIPVDKAVNLFPLYVPVWVTNSRFFTLCSL
jgi:hypothetical protein